MGEAHLEFQEPPAEPLGVPEKVVEELAAFRFEYDPTLEQEIFFHTRILGGRWTKANRGVVADGISGYARGNAPKEWCSIFSWPRQHAIMYNRYGIHGATMLSAEYVRKSHYYFGLWINSDDEDFQYTLSICKDMRRTWSSFSG